MTFDNTKDTEKLMRKELCVGFVFTKVPPINYLKDDLSFFDDILIDICTTNKFRDCMRLFCVPKRNGGGYQLFGRIGYCLNGTGKCI